MKCKKIAFIIIMCYNIYIYIYIYVPRCKEKSMKITVTRELGIVQYKLGKHAVV